ncbi:hypothetical protein BZA05DRAFT_404657 [Tricharina praecox]|uniref:uncharacterized protein n=1 Tax=Tricharina praecox TaxID=43433 RepID=UPI0022209E1D|nr:uncharacterized protein BZA05DRAFT_404657 [Tricharina praecox]KAI5848176.1 hypothetical protein BZA05DRAFT_404657 [Tricharina praecox]
MYVIFTIFFVAFFFPPRRLCSTLQYSTIQYSPVQYSTAKFQSTDQCKSRPITITMMLHLCMYHVTNVHAFASTLEFLRHSKVQSPSWRPSTFSNLSNFSSTFSPTWTPSKTCMTYCRSVPTRL